MQAEEFKIMNQLFKTSKDKMMSSSEDWENLNLFKEK